MKALFNFYALTLAMLAIYCAVLMTEPGQMIGVPRDWLLNYYRYMPQFWAGQAVALAIFWFMNIRGKFWKPIWMWLASAGVLLTFWVESMDRIIDDVMLALFEEPLEEQRNMDNPDFIFDTLNLDDTRLNPNQEIFGYDNGTEQIAIDPGFARANDEFVFQLGGEDIQISTDGQVVSTIQLNGRASANS